MLKWKKDRFWTQLGVQLLGGASRTLGQEDAGGSFRGADGRCGSKAQEAGQSTKEIVVEVAANQTKHAVRQPWCEHDGSR